MTKPVIVIGMHRSGTSLCVEYLETLGIFMGDDQEYNRESKFFLKCNKWLMACAGGTWFNPTILKKFSEYAVRSPEVTEYLRNQLSNNFIPGYHKNRRKLITSENIWGWKDPQNSFTALIWLSIFPNARIIHVTRGEDDVVASLQKRTLKIKARSILNAKKLRYLFFWKRSGFSPAFNVESDVDCKNLCREYVEACELVTDLYSNQSITISYDNMLNRQVETQKILSNFLGTEIVAGPPKIERRS